MIVGYASHFSKLIFTLILLILFACGGGGGGSTPPGAKEPPPPGSGNATANAGVDVDVNRGELVSLNGSGSTDPESSDLSYIWTQVYGTDVTGSSGVLTGETPSFTAPDKVSTVMFDLYVNDGQDSASDRIIIRVMENKNAALFVDGDVGNDTTGNGSRISPFATISHALSTVSVENEEDIYVKTHANNIYSEAEELIVKINSSLYGGYDANWVRDVTNNRTFLTGSQRIIRFSDFSGDIWFSGFDITGESSVVADQRTYGLAAVNLNGTLHVLDNVITTGDVAGSGITSVTPESSYGVYAKNMDGLFLRNNVISSGQAGNASDGVNGANGVGGGNSTSRSGGKNSEIAALNGYDGGSIGTSINGLGPCGGQGGTSSNINGSSACNGASGSSGSHASLAGASWGSVNPANNLYINADGQSGVNGNNGTPGSGGGAGYTAKICRVINGELFCYLAPGGGGGGAGSGGHGGIAGHGGGGSFGVFVANVNSISLNQNIINSGQGGNAGLGGNGGAFSLGGSGAPGSAGSEPPAGNGGNGGGGGNGGAGGDASGGGGGPSVGVYIGSGVLSGLIDGSNSIIAGTGGNGGDTRNGRGGNGGASYGVINDTGGASIMIEDMSIVVGTGGSGGISTGSGSNGIAGLTAAVFNF